MLIYRRWCIPLMPPWPAEPTRAAAAAEREPGAHSPTAAPGDGPGEQSFADRFRAEFHLDRAFQCRRPVATSPLHARPVEASCTSVAPVLPATALPAFAHAGQKCRG